MALEIGLLGNEFFTNVILPFILVFTVVFAILEKVKVLGEKKDIHAIVALVISLIAVGVPAAVGTLQRFIPLIAVVLIILFAWMLVFGFAGKSVEAKWSEGLKKFFMIFLGVVLLATAVWAVTSSTGILDKINLDQVLSAQITQMILFVGAIVAIIAIAVSGGGEEKPGHKDK